ncbi:MAG: PDDEXK nuclease domain-containing protein [Deltaproteobacteria bacterium]|nr:PDDEXK nuclease domain-containing protein [Deltaproteobacteria bacterium]
MKKNIVSSGGQAGIYQKIRNILESAQSKAYRQVNSIMVQAYWEIGRTIVWEEQKGKNRADYGDRLIQSLSKRLTQDYGKGFNETNIWYMRQFYLAFPIIHAVRGESPIRNALRSELSWTHYRLLLKVENPQARAYYIEESIASQWSTRQLERQINSFYYERLLSSKSKGPVKKEAAHHTVPTEPHDIIKDPFVLEFLNVKQNEKLLETDLESLLIEKLRGFLLELGRGFAFVERQKRISADHDHFYVDLVFYNYALKCFVLIDLKMGKLTHQDIGQMDFYVRFFEDKIRRKDDNPTIGLVLCSEKNETIVKYSVLNNSRHLFASKYKFYLPTEQELKNEIAHERRIIEAAKAT